MDAIAWRHANLKKRGQRMGILGEFKTFAVKGNVVDMAVGIIIGAAFGKIVSSLVGDMIMPPIGVLIGGVDFTELAFTLKEVGTESVKLNYGRFLQALLDFIIVAFAVFLLVKGINALRRQQAEASVVPPAPTAEEKLLIEIRDLLKSR